ncbi:MAG: hypothetical protein HOH43_15025 [Candidatus Latescibacteria bacterium]|nr:hypothetical protein [Candidatus Latescibacterota bacterium]
MDQSKNPIIFNGDWGAMFWAPNLWQPEGGPYTAKAIESFTKLLSDSGVDTFAISPNTQIAWYPSKVVPTALDGYTRGDQRWARWMRSHSSAANIAMMDRYLDLVEAKVDWLAEAISQSRKRHITPWISVRTNDPHGYLEKWIDNPINCPLFKDPANVLKGTPLRPGKHADVLWTGLNYERQEVRDYFMAMIRELVMDYDADGLELDFLRTPAICEPGASQKTVEIITDWISEIRALTCLKQETNGRPYSFGLRVPAALGALKAIGLDVQTIVSEGLVDFLSFSNYMQTAWDLPLDQLRSVLGPDITIYGNIESGLNGLPVSLPGDAIDTGEPQVDAAHRAGTEMRSPYIVTPALLGAAAGKWILGADGIELYNYYAVDEDNGKDRVCTKQNMRADYSAIKHLKSLKSMRGLPKMYALSTILSPVWNPPFDTPDQLPAVLEPDWRRGFRIPMCAEPDDPNLEMIVQIVVDLRDSLPPIAVSFNDSWPSLNGEPTSELLFPQNEYTHHTPEHTAFNYVMGVGSIRDGWNDVSVYNGSHERHSPSDRRANSITIRSIELAIRRTDGR